MSYYCTCPDCGAHLDPGEVCDCREETKAASGTRNTSGGGVEHVDHDSASHDT